MYELEEIENYKAIVEEMNEIIAKRIKKIRNSYYIALGLALSYTPGEISEMLKIAHDAEEEIKQALIKTKHTLDGINEECFGDNISYDDKESAVV